MKELAAGLTVIFLTLVTIWYVPLVWRKQVHPAPATYIIVVIAFWIASASHLAVPELSLWEKLLANVTLYLATIEATVILGLIMYVYKRSGEWNVAFDWIQKLCLAGMVVGLLYWALHRDQQDVLYWATQALMVVGYIATIAKALQKKSAFDSIGNWLFISMSAVSGLIPAIMMGSWYGIGNSVRAIVMSGLTIGILVYYDRQTGFARWKAEIETLREVYGFRSVRSAKLEW